MRSDDLDDLVSLIELITRKVASHPAPREVLGDLLARSERADVLDWIPRYESPDVLVDQTVRTLDRRGQVDEDLISGLIAGEEEDTDAEPFSWRRELLDVARELGLEPGMRQAAFQAADELDGGREITYSPPEPDDEVVPAVPLADDAPGPGIDPTRHTRGLADDGPPAARAGPVDAPSRGRPGAAVSPEVLARVVRASRAVARIRVVDGNGRLSLGGNGVLLTPDLVLTPAFMVSDRPPEPEAATVIFADLPASEGGSHRTVGAKTVWIPREWTHGAVLRLHEPAPARPDFLVSEEFPALGEHLSLVAHFELGAQRVAFGALVAQGVRDGHLRYVGPSWGGSAGGAVLDRDGRLVAVHHSAVPEEDGFREAFLISAFLQETKFQAPGLWAEFLSFHQELRYLDPRLEHFVRGEPSQGAVPLSIEVVPGSDLDPSEIPDLEVVARTGNVFGALGSHRSVQRLRDTAGVASLRLADERGRQDTAGPLALIGAEPIHVAPPPAGELGGESVVGIIDGGIDPLHDAFVGPDGRSRIDLYLDTRSGAAPGPFSPAGQGLWDRLALNQGTLYVAADIDGFRSAGSGPPGLPVDVAHGTEVASIAAGRRCGTGTGSHFAGGVAPGARLAVIRFHDGIGFLDSIAGALGTLERYSALVDRPIIVNLSVGTNAGPHDGKSRLERECGRFCAVPGRVIVKSAGNEARAGRHATMELQEGMRSFVWTVPDGQTEVRLEIWYPAGNRYLLKLELPTEGKSDVYRTAPRRSVQNRLPNGDLLQLGLDPFHPDNGEGYVELIVRPGPTEGVVQPGDWCLEVTAEAVFNSKMGIHAWLDINGDTLFEDGERKCTITTPGTSEAVITVGARNSVDPRKMERTSSWGPTRQGNPKPDICAPGVAVAAAAAGTGVRSCACTGSSYAAPHVTGALALLYSALKRRGLPFPSRDELTARLRTEGLLEGTPKGHDEQAGWGTVGVRQILSSWQLDVP